MIIYISGDLQKVTGKKHYISVGFAVRVSSQLSICLDVTISKIISVHVLSTNDMP